MTNASMKNLVRTIAQLQMDKTWHLEKCECTTDCGTNMCSCLKSGQLCTFRCKCNLDRCFNRNRNLTAAERLVAAKAAATFVQVHKMAIKEAMAAVTETVDAVLTTEG